MPLFKLPAFSRLTVLMLIIVLQVKVMVAQDASLSIGSKAPSIEIMKWKAGADAGELEKVEFESGKIYVIDFWTTWCRPSREELPQIAELLKKYSSSQVSSLCITDEDWKTVTDFMESPILKDGKKTGKKYSELLKNSTIAVDGSGQAYSQYLDSAGISFIPVVFVIGKTGVIEWIGYPASLEKPLEAVVKNKWNREEFAIQFAAQAKLNEVFRSAMQLALSGNEPEAKALLDKMLAANPDSETIAQILMFREMLSSQMRRAPRAIPESDSIGFYRDRLKSLLNSPRELQEFANWLAKTSANQEGLDALIPETIEALQKTIDTSDTTTANYLLQSLARLQKAIGKLDDAIASQKKCVETSTEVSKPRKQAFLDELIQLKSDATFDKKMTLPAPDDLDI